MYRQAKTKLRATVGETIGETLVSLLIAAFAMLMLAGAVGAAANVITTSKNKMDAYYLADKNMAVKSSSGSVDVKVTLKNDGTNTGVTDALGEQEFTGKLYKNDTFASKVVASYSAAREENEG